MLALAPSTPPHVLRRYVYRRLAQMRHG